MRSCAGFSAPCSCLTVVAVEAAWTGAGTGGAAGPGPAVPTPGSVFTVEERSRGVNFMSLPRILGFSFLFVFDIDGH